MRTFRIHIAYFTRSPGNNTCIYILHGEVSSRKAFIPKIGSEAACGWEWDRVNAESN